MAEKNDKSNTPPDVQISNESVTPRKLNLIALSDTPTKAQINKKSTKTNK